MISVMLIGQAYGTIYFSNYDSNIAIDQTNSKVFLNNSEKVIGWSELSIVKKFGEDQASGWVEQYPNQIVVSQEGSQEPNTNLIISNSNAINYGLKNNSNAILALAAGAFTIEEKEELLEDVRTTSNAFLYCCKNTSSALVYGLKNNSNAITDLRAGTFSESEKEELLEDVRTTSNAFLYCCKNTSNALVYGITNNRNAIACFPLTLCGSECCGVCEPVTRGEEPFDGAPSYAEASKGRQGERGKNKSMSSRTSMISPDNKYVALLVKHEDGHDICVYAFGQNTQARESLSLIAHDAISERIMRSGEACYVTWNNNGNYIGVGVEQDTGELELLLYEFDAGQETLRFLPGLDTFLQKI